MIPLITQPLADWAWRLLRNLTAGPETPETEEVARQLNQLDARQALIETERKSLEEERYRIREKTKRAAKSSWLRRHRDALLVNLVAGLPLLAIGGLIGWLIAVLVS